MTMRRWLIFIWTMAVAAGAGSGVALASADQPGKRPATERALWYATSNGLRTVPVTQQMHAKVSLSSSERYPVPGDRVTLSGQVIPSHAGDRILLQRQEGKVWKVVATQTLSARSRFSILRRLGQPGNFTYRAALPAGARNLWPHSRPLSLSVSELHKVKHVVIVMQENRSFDQYFGTFRGAKGIPGLAGNPGSVPCMPDPQNQDGGCDRPFHDQSDQNFGGPHLGHSAVADLNCSNPATDQGCGMNGFAVEAEHGRHCTGTDPLCSECKVVANSTCPDVMGYHTGADIPNYWRYARGYVLQDHMFHPARSWST